MQQARCSTARQELNPIRLGLTNRIETFNDINEPRFIELVNPDELIFIKGHIADHQLLNSLVRHTKSPNIVEFVEPVYIDELKNFFNKYNLDLLTPQEVLDILTLLDIEIMAEQEIILDYYASFDNKNKCISSIFNNSDYNIYN